MLPAASGGLGALQVTIDIKGAVEDAEDLHHIALAHEVGDAVMPLQQHADVALWRAPVLVAHLREVGKNLDLIVDSLRYLGRVGRAVLRDVLVDVLKPGGRLFGPP